MANAAPSSVEETIESLGNKVTALEDSLCEHKAYLHAVEALILQLIADHGIDEDAAKASLAALLHDAPKTDAIARERASYLVNFRRLARSPALYNRRGGRSKTKPKGQDR